LAPKGAVQIIKHSARSKNAGCKHWEEVKHKTYRESLRDNAPLIRQSCELAQSKPISTSELDLDQFAGAPRRIALRL